MQSRFEFDGWEGHYLRMTRWKQRLLNAAMSPEPSMDEQIDYALAFFQTAYHLRDYLLADGVVSKPDLDELFASNGCLRLCRDLCNGAKHRNISRRSVEAKPIIVRQAIDEERWELVVVAQGVVTPVVPLTFECSGVWRTFVIEQHLNPRSLSGLAQVIELPVEPANASGVS